jgi:hypothetical protein
MWITDRSNGLKLRSKVYAAGRNTQITEYRTNYQVIFAIFHPVLDDIHINLLTTFFTDIMSD